MKDNELDELFRSGVQTNYPVDPALWSAVEPSLPAPSSGSGLWVFILNGIAIISVLFFGNHAMDNARSLQANEMKTIATSLQIEEPTNINSKEILMTSKRGSQTDLIAATITNERNTENKKISKSNAGIVQETTIPNEKETSIEINNDKVLSSNQTLKTKANEPFNAEKQALNADKPIVRTANSIMVKKEASTVSKTKPQYTSLASNYTNPEFLLPISLSLPLALNEGITALPLTPKSNDGLFMPTKRIQFSQFELVYSRSFNTKKSVSGLSEAVIDLKANAEQNATVTTIGLNLINHYKWLTYGVGVHYFKQEEKVKYQIVDGEIRDVISFDTIYNVINTNYSSNGHPVILIENKINQVNTPTYFEFGNSLIGTNTFERIQVPVFIGVNKQINNWTAELRTGLVANYALRQNGAYINEDLNELVGFGERKQFNDLVLGQSNNLSVGYQLNEIFSIGGRINYEFDLTSITVDYNSRLRTTRGGVWILIKPR